MADTGSQSASGDEAVINALGQDIGADNHSDKKNETEKMNEDTTSAVIKDQQTPEQSSTDCASPDAMVADGSQQDLVGEIFNNDLGQNSGADNHSDKNDETEKMNEDTTSAVITGQSPDEQSGTGCSPPGSMLVEGLQDELQQSKQREQDMKADLERLKEQLKIKERELMMSCKDASKMKEETKSKQIEIERLTQLVEKSEAQINSKQIEIERLTQLVEKSEAQINRLENQLKEDKTKLATLNGELEQSKNNLTQSIRDVHNKDETCKRLENQLKDNETKLATLNGELEQSKNMLTQSKRDVYNKDETCKRKINEYKQLLEDMKVKEEELKQNKTMLEADLNKKKHDHNQDLLRFKEEHRKMCSEKDKLMEDHKTMIDLTTKQWKQDFNDQESKYEQKIQKLKENIERIKDCHKNEKKDYEKAKTEIGRLHCENRTLCSQNDIMKQKLCGWTNAYYKLEATNHQEINQKMHMIEEKDRMLLSIQKQVKELDQERSTLVLRLSKIAGAKLTTNNANIADLSDENRPTKLAEKFSELYDNEWTDAFEEICEHGDEKEGIQFMLNILQRSFSLCTEMSNDHIESLKRSATTTKYTTTKRAKIVKENSKSAVDEDIKRQNRPGDDSNAKDGSAQGDANQTVVLSDQKVADDETTRTELFNSTSEVKSTGSASELTDIADNQNNLMEVAMEVDNHDQNRPGDESNAKDQSGHGDSNQTVVDVETTETESANPEEKSTGSSNAPAVIYNTDNPGQFSDKQSPMEEDNDVIGRGQSDEIDSVQTDAKTDQKRADDSTSEKESSQLRERNFIQDVKPTEMVKLSSIADNSSGTHTNVDTGKPEPFVESCSSTVVDISIPGALTSEYLKQLLDMRKVIGLQMEQLVIEKVTNSIAAELDLDLDKRTMTCTYIKKCVQLCWSMGLKDPPVYMNIMNPDTDTKFDTDVYKAYTKTGKRLLFVVWPPLYLHKGGPLLSKGVAQGVGK